MSTAVNAAADASQPESETWTQAELDEVRAELERDVADLEERLQANEEALKSLLEDGTAGVGDAADIGSSAFEREQEISLVANARETLEQSRAALRMIDEGTYGTCENCGGPIAKARLQVFPRATMCVTCKKRLERR
ncbi:TraR/DksA family transcriptional regulator [Parenemella sanctibonifatiensis]|uniref:DNA-binding protein n=1 Tax=Parenemella sanctibonifatiensis TaxID=2016505 RepID=A0A255EFV6_9ACTN|nr:TraR/DksA family transcriptional regulator [Parenemella sanctibonifatiensis]OYN88324.1 DNA-binding protein [Parenemella sanctibonifatiensis]OYN89841.1 DNA-binding protein [Parenemella sanctibonifatiensis]